MANQPWLEEVRRRLAESRLPPDYLRRFMDELSDHVQDITEENMSTETNVSSRLGAPNQLAEAVIVAYRRRSFFGRHPSAKFWVFAVSPVAAMSALFVLSCCGIAAFGEICQRCGLHLTDNSHLGSVSPATLRWGFSLATTILPAAALMLLYCECAWRYRIGLKWMLVSGGVLAAVAMLPFQSIALSDAPGKSLWTIGLGFPPGLLQYVQLIVPLAVGLWFIGRTRSRVREDVSTRVAA